jgi:hypothetical protein
MEITKMKTFKQFTETVERRNSEDENAFIDKHVVDLKKHPVAKDDQFIAKNPGKKDASKRASYHNGQDKEVYESFSGILSEQIVDQPAHTQNFAGDEHYKHTGGEHADKPANLSDKQAMDHHRASQAHEDSAAKHRAMAMRATSEKSKRAHYSAMQAHQEAAKHHDNAHYHGATNHDVHMAHHIGDYANDQSRYVQSRIIKKKR